MYFRSDDLDPLTGVVKPGVFIEPLILRANAGECIVVALTNNLPTGPQFDLDGFNTMPMIVNQFNANQVRPSSQDRKSTRLNSSHSQISYAVFCLKKKRRASKK